MATFRFGERAVPRARPASATAVVARRRRLALTLAVLCAAAAMLLALASAQAHAAEVTSFDGGAFEADGSPATQAGAHPFEVTTTIAFSERAGGVFGQIVEDSFRDLRVDMPVGFVGNPTSLPTCSERDLTGLGLRSTCPLDSQVGVTVIRTNLLPMVQPVFNMSAAPGQAATFGINVAGVVIHLNARIRPDDLGISVETLDTDQTLAIKSLTLTLWGAPQDPRHDGQRCYVLDIADDAPACAVNNPPTAATVPARGFLANPTRCAGQPVRTVLRATFWGAPDDVEEASFLSHDDASPPDPVALTGCERVPFAPQLAARTTASQPDAPTGLTVKLSFDQRGLESPMGVAEGHLKDAVVVLPEGMTINPASADGLQTCSDAQAALGTDAPVTCPDASKIGTVTAASPLLPKPLTGGVYLRPQASADPASGDMFRILADLADPERGIDIKLAGRISADPVTGRLTTRFLDNPQMPVSSFEMRFKDGPRASLLTPPTCGTKTVEAHLTAWSGQQTELRSSFEIDCPTGLGAFAPALTAGTVNPVGGAFSPLTVQIAKPAGQPDLTGLSLTLPAGLLAVLKGNLGTQVGTARVAAGPGPSPFWLSGPVVLEGRYGDAPFSLRVTVPAKAGPFDLGEVVVRQKVYVDPKDAHVTVVSDPLPTVVKGVPVRLARLAVDVDKPGFTFNPTSCAPKWLSATLGATGAQHRTGSRFQVGDCVRMALSPAIAVSGGGKGNTKRFQHPALKVSIKQPGAQAHLDAADVVLPQAFNVDLQAPSLKAACAREVYVQDKCSPVARVGTVKAVTPVFAEPLTGPAFLLQKKGQLPDIVMRLQNVHYRIDLIGVLDFLKDGRVITRVRGIPDAPISSFELSIKGGKGGSLLNRSDLCAKRAATQATFKGQNGKRSLKTPTTRIAGCPKRAVGSRS